MEKLFGKKLNQTRIVPVSLKIVFLFTIFILVSNLSTNYINLVFNISELTKLTKQLLIKDLNSVNEFCNTQYEIYQYSRDLNGSIKGMEDKGLRELKNAKAVVLGLKEDGRVLFQASRIKAYDTFGDTDTLNIMKEKLQNNIKEGFLPFTYNNEEYFGIYKYNPKWKMFIIRAEEYNEFYRSSRTIFKDISIIILLITLACAVVGVFVLRYILRFIGIISSNIMKMIEHQKMELINLKGAPNDDITLLGIAFNSLSNTIDTLVNIFRKFANRDVALKAYKEMEIRLEGNKMDLAILFSDIKSFTFITETLGTDIIKLLNMHYDKAIRKILEQNGTIGSIIGDAILAVFGTMPEQVRQNKSYEAVLTAYSIQEVSEELRMSMHKAKEEIVKKYGSLTEGEEKVYRAVLLEVGVGIDGGEVFYGNIGSHVRMTNTVIGDNVNSAARLEGLTRIYKIPVICSEYIKRDIETNVKNHKLHFIEIDRVQVKGKTQGKTIFLPLPDELYEKKLRHEASVF
ncbi:MAG: adenylate/guanylate cyclase domain-containing protein, partial [bacterium]|nr:adenylate/guanylate cyclase domain-containing protein [bacterium]